MKKLTLLIAVLVNGCTASFAQSPKCYLYYVDSAGYNHIATTPMPQVAISGYFSNVLNRPTTMIGYGISDGVTTASMSSALTPYLLTATATSTYQPLLGFTAYNATNPAGYITSATAASTYQPIGSYLTATSGSNTLSKIASYTVLSTDFAASKQPIIVLNVDCTSASNTQTLPTTGLSVGATVIITKTDATANTLTIANLGYDNIIGSKNWEKEVVWNGTTWTQK